MSEPSDALTLILTRNQYYRRLYLLTLAAFVLSVVTIISLFGVFVFIKRGLVRPLYFATNSIGQLIPIIPVDQPNMDDEAIKAWAADAVTHTYSYDYVNYHEQLQYAQKYFTRYGWSAYLRALTASNNLLALTERKMIVQSTVTGKPTILKKGLLGKTFAWKVEIPMLSAYWVSPYDNQSKFSNAFTITMIIQRQSVLDGYQGLGIVQTISNMVSSPSGPRTLTNTPGAS